MVHKDGEIMSKSKGNTVAPDEVIGEYGADTLRLYILAEGPPENPLEWEADRIVGCHRLILRTWRLVERHAGTLDAGRAGDAGSSEAARTLRRKVHQTIQKVTDDVERMHLNTATSAFHGLANEICRLEADLPGAGDRPALREALETLVLLMNPFTPHVCEEMWRKLGHADGLVDQAWPWADENAAREDELELAVQVNGKVRGRITVAREAGDDEVRRRALAEPKVAEHLAGREVVKLVVVPGRLVSVVVK
jgi:leucyl-tRNA synthetase